MKKIIIIVLAVITLVLGASVVLYLESLKREGVLTENLTGQMYREIVNPSGFVNTNGEEVTIGEHLDTGIVLIEFMTYSCANCQRSFPHVVAWHEKYKDDGLSIIGIHTPEFAFEHDIKNVEAAMEKSRIEFPIVLDNEYATWKAYGNHYWPRTFLIDRDGTIVYDHIGAGEYEEIEAKIREYLNLE